MTIHPSITEVTLPIRNLDTYRTGKVWQTLWHRDQIAPGTAVNAIKPLGGEPLEVGGQLSQSGVTGTITAIQAAKDNAHWIIHVTSKV